MNFDVVAPVSGGVPKKNGVPRNDDAGDTNGIRPLSIAVVTVAAILCHLALRSLRAAPTASNLPLLAACILGGVPLIVELLKKLWHREFGSDLLAGISIITSLLMGEYLAGTIVVLMLSGGAALESYALRNASSVLGALAKRMPAVAHRKTSAQVAEVAIEELSIGDEILVFPHEICPVDGIVIEGHGSMDESYLTGEPFQIVKTRGSQVLSGAVNGDAVLTIRACQVAADSRYAKVTAVMRESQASRPRLRRLGDSLGAIYTPVALLIAGAAWAVSGVPLRFLAVLVIATPCPLLIGIPVAIIGSISLCAKRGIIIKNAVVLERIASCRTAIFDKTGTLTYGEPQLVELDVASAFDNETVMNLIVALERYSKHPLSRAVLRASTQSSAHDLQATEVNEPPGQGLVGTVAGHGVQITSRDKFNAQHEEKVPEAKAMAGGLECVVAIDDHYAATLRFRDAPRSESSAFVRHLGPNHHFQRVMIVSGDRELEVRYLADQVGIQSIQAGKSPEQKLEIVRAETAHAETLYVGDGINDAPAMMAATVGIAIGQSSDVTTEAADVVILDNSLAKIDEFIHISTRMRQIALQSAVGGMVLSLVGMGFAATGHLPPVSGAIAQEVIDVVAVLNALRAAFPPRLLADV